MITIYEGPRRSGKTTLLLRLIEGVYKSGKEQVIIAPTMGHLMHLRDSIHQKLYKREDHQKFERMIKYELGFEKNLRIKNIIIDEWFLLNPFLRAELEVMGSNEDYNIVGVGTDVRTMIRDLEELKEIIKEI